MLWSCLSPHPLLGSSFWVVGAEIGSLRQSQIQQHQELQGEGLNLKVSQLGSQWRFLGKPIRSCCRTCSGRGRIREALEIQYILMCFLIVTHFNSPVSQFHHPHLAEVLQGMANNHGGALFFLLFLSFIFFLLPFYVIPIPCTRCYLKNTHPCLNICHHYSV